MSGFLTDTSVVTFLVLAVAALAASLGLAVLYARRAEAANARDRRTAEQIAHLLEIQRSQPDGIFTWDMVRGGTRCSSRLAVLLNLKNGRQSSIEDVIRCFEGESRNALATAIDDLKRHGHAFELALTRSRGRGARLIHAIGTRTSADDATPIADQIWMRDASAVAHAERGLGFLPEGAEGAMLRILLDTLPFPVWLRSGDLVPAFVNRAAGADAPLDNTRHMAARALEDGGAQTEQHLLTTDGAARLLEVTEVPLPGGGTIGYAIDRTSAEEMEGEFARHVTAHEQVLESLNTAIAIFGADARLQFHNSAFIDLWQVDPAWLKDEPTLGAVLDRLRFERKLPEFADFRAFREEQVGQIKSLSKPVETLLHCPDGTTVRAVANPHPLGGLVMIYENVTDRLALERSHKTLVAVQRETLDHLYEGVAVFGADGRMKLHNPSFARLWKLDGAALGNEPHMSDFVEAMRPLLNNPGDSGPDWETHREKLIADLMRREGNSGRIHRTDGTTLDFASVPLPDGGVLLSYLDATDSARAERALRERAEGLAEAMRLRSEFISSVSYEIRTPLNTISGFADILSGEHFGELNPRQAEYASGILESSRTLMQVVSDILDFASIEAGTMALELDTVDIHSALSEALLLIRETARRKNLKVDFDCPPDIGWMVADKKRLKQIVFNLLSNAVNATATPGSVRLKASREDGDVVFQVSDTGNQKTARPTPQIGMFDGMEPAFHEATGDRTDSGLGLSLVRRFTEMHGGRIEAKSTPKRGHTIICRLPAGNVPREKKRNA